MAASTDLTGRVVGVTADRRGDDQVVMFERLGAEVVLGPTISTVRIPDPDTLRRRTEEIVADPPDYLIANTGIGMRTWFAAADEWGAGDGLRAALGRTRLACRGPKASAALSSAGLTAWWRSPGEQLGELIDHLIDEDLTGTRVALQLHGDDGAEYVARLRSAGASVTTVPVYEWRPPADPAPARHLIDRICAGGVDAVTFTAGPQVRSLLDLAGNDGRRAELVAALETGKTVVGCIGPVCAGVAADLGITRTVVPESWRLGSLVKAVAAELSR